MVGLVKIPLVRCVVGHVLLQAVMVVMAVFRRRRKNHWLLLAMVGLV
jgi:hypothetical protein